MTPELEKTLIALADKLGTTVEHLWSVMIYQARIVAIQNAVTLAIIGAVLFFAGRVLITRWRSYDNKDEAMADGLIVMGGAAYTVIGSVLALVAIFAVNEMITAIFNPEYWALSQILSR